MMNNEFAFVEVFAGAGGLGTGFAQVGLEPTVAIELDPIACETYKMNHPNTHVWCMDIKDVTGQMIREVVGNKKVVLLGGAPCPSWSEFNAGRDGNGLQDPRGQLIYQYLRVVEELKPVFTIFENVSYIVSDEHMPEFNKFKDKLRKTSNLTLEYRVLNSLNFGVAQLRERLILIGYSDEFTSPFEFLEKVEGPKTLQEQLKDCPQSEYAEFDSYGLNIMKQIPAGKCWQALKPNVALQAMGKDYRGICTECGTKYNPYFKKKCPTCSSESYRNGTGATGYWRRLSFDKPSYTVCTVLTTKPNGTLTHPVEDRGLSVREVARIQGFPDEYEFAGTMKDKYRQIGNAVPVTLGRAIALAVKKAIEQASSETTDAMEWINRFVNHPKRNSLTSLERDLLNSVYRICKQKKPVPERHIVYMKETFERLQVS